MTERPTQVVRPSGDGRVAEIVAPKPREEKAPVLVEPERTLPVLVQRIFLLQILLIALTSVLVLVAIKSDIGFFWFGFVAGMLGASVALLRRAQKDKAVLVEETLRSWSTTMMPFLYGGVLAGVIYFLFISQIISGVDGNGLLAMNLFPDFEAIGLGDGRLEVRNWLDLRPKELTDAGTLIVWCFVAGYSESFVLGFLQRLEQKSGNEQENVAHAH